MPQEQLLNSIIQYFRQEVFEPHLLKLETENADLNSYSANPFLTPFLSRIVQNDYDAIGVAKALYYSRTLSTSINTSFGVHIRKVLVQNNLAQNINSRSNIISFIDKTNDLLTGCILKAGPKTINSGDIAGICNKLDNLNDMDQLAVGVIYGFEDDLNPSYLQLRNRHAVLVGSDFWHRITGYDDFYNQLSRGLDDLSNDLNIGAQFQIGLERLTEQIQVRFF